MKYPGTDIDVPMPLNDWELVKAADIMIGEGCPSQRIAVFRNTATDKIELFHVKRHGMTYEFLCKTDAKASFTNTAAVEEKVKEWLRDGYTISMRVQSDSPHKPYAWIEGRTGQVFQYGEYHMEIPGTDIRTSDRLHVLLEFEFEEEMPNGKESVMLHRWVELYDLIVQNVWKATGNSDAIRDNTKRLTRRKLG